MGRKTFTYVYDTVGSDIDFASKQRNLGESNFGGVIFGATSDQL